MRFIWVAGILLTTSALLLAQNSVPLAVEWLPVTEEDRSATKPEVDPQAGVEGLFWRIHVQDEINQDGLQRVMYNYVRLKVFTAAGQEIASKLDLLYDEKTTITAIAGRTIKPDGSILELKKDAIHDVQIVKVGRLRRNAKRLSMPAVEPGVIVEYRWKELRHNQNSGYLRLQFQREYPIRKVTYFVKPFSTEFVSLKASVWPFNCTPTKLNRENTGFHSTSLSNVAAYKDEPMMPGEPNVRAWALFFYHDGSKREPQKYWEHVGKEEYREMAQSLKVTDEVKSAVAKAMQDRKGDEDQVLPLIRYIRKNVRGFFDANVTDAERADAIKKMPKGRFRTATEVLKGGIGTPNERNLVFAAMATHAGLEVRPALVADRSDIIFDPSLTESYFLRNIDMAVKSGETWRLLDISATHHPAGMLSWQEEGMQALISDPKKPVFVTSKLSPPEASLKTRRGNLKIEEDGTATGTLTESYTGHAAAEKRMEYERQSDETRNESFKNSITRRFPRAEVDEIKFTNLDDPEQALTIAYKLTIPNCAQRTGKRMFLSPFLWQRTEAPLFDAAERKYDILFPYAWTEEDNIGFNLPAGFEFEAAEPPGNLSFGNAGGIETKLVMLPTGRLIMQRKLVFGGNGQIMFPATGYPQVKKIFDEINRRDNLSISLRQGGPAAGAK